MTEEITKIPRKDGTYTNVFTTNWVDNQTIVGIVVGNKRLLVERKDNPELFADIIEYGKYHQIGGSSSLCQRCAIKPFFGIDEQYAYPAITAIVFGAIGYFVGKK